MTHPGPSPDDASAPSPSPDDAFSAYVARLVLKGSGAWSPDGVRHLIVGLAQQRGMPTSGHYDHVQAVARIIRKRFDDEPALGRAYAKGELRCAAALIDYARLLTQVEKKSTEHHAGQRQRRDMAGLRIGEGQPRVRRDPAPVRNPVADTAARGDHRGPRSRP